MPHGFKRKPDYSDLLDTPNDGRRYELIRGELFVNPCPVPVHQRISLRLEQQLAAFFHGRSHELFHAPIDLILTDHDVFVPDILVVSGSAHISKRGIEHPPLLVVEILSPSTRRVDSGLKATRYAELGVEHYWIVDPDLHRIECLRLEEGAYRERIAADGDTTLAHPDFEGLVIDVAALWRQSPAS